MDKTKVGKFVVTFVASAAVSKVVSNAVKATTPFGVGTVDKVMIAIGSYVVSSMVADKAIGYVGKVYDEAIEMVRETIDKQK